ncbi:hypothetical protein SLEP1_g53274 [Rubroshorea leprosula]|uniref:Retrovirus-related Pol polyprotein from transposon TNT 1-94 n=1 Tax=Rubroshorea leprosula TaxID=152421 RepID=A0AAV5MCH1_9ROSI|nr:hypothetical protein SLEP1_g53274 [Rubroshorea leprosula]
MAKNYLFQAIDWAILETILNKSTSKTIWDSMTKKYQGNERAKQQQRQALTMAIANKMRIHGENLEDVAIVEKILRSMTTKFIYVVFSINESNDIEALSLDELQNSLLIYEWKIDRQDKQEQAMQISQTQALQTIVNSRAVSRGKENWKGRSRSDRLRSEHNQKSDDASLFMVYHPKEVSEKNVWYLDTGCSNHMCVKGRGKVTIRAKNNSVQTIANVLYVPDLKSNLLSLGQLQEKGYEILIKDGVCQVHDPKLGLIVKVKMTGNRLFPLYLQTTNLSFLSTKMKDTAWFWHYQDGHLYFGGLKALQQKKMVNGLPHFDSPSEICEI